MKPLVLIATPLRGANVLDNPHPKFKALLEDIGSRETPFEFYFATMEGGICHARNKLVQTAKEMGAKWIVWLDYDIEATLDDILRLLSHKKPRVGALYTTRTDKHCHWVANFMHEVTLQGDGLLQVIECGTGLKVEHIQVYEGLDKVYPQIAYTDRDTGERLHAYFQQQVMPTDLRPDGDWLTEDYFCDHLCRLAKIGLFVDTKVRVRHRGPTGTRYPVNAQWPPIPGLDFTEDHAKADGSNVHVQPA